MQGYYALRQQAGPAGWQALKVEAVDFQNRVAQRCGISAAGDLPPDSGALGACLQRGYAEQRSVWMSRLTGLALEEASRPVEQHLALQRDLQTLGFLPSAATIDGVYGAATRSAILAWQRSRRLPETGFLASVDGTSLESQTSNPDAATVVAHAGDIACSAVGAASFAELNPIVIAHEPDMLALDTQRHRLIHNDRQLMVWTREVIIECGQHPAGQTLLSTLPKTYERLAKYELDFQALTGRESWPR